MRAPIRTALIVGIVTVAVAILLSGCGSAGGQTQASASASRSTSTTLPRPPSSPPSTHSTVATTESTVPGEIRGTATDFCSAFANFATGTGNSKTFPDFLNVLKYAIADIRGRAAEPRVQSSNSGDLVGVSKDIQLLSIMTSTDLAGQCRRCSRLDGVAISHYLTQPHLTLAARNAVQRRDAMTK
jgi:hypothetical protein